jgi:hypothetical protein
LCARAYAIAQPLRTLAGLRHATVEAHVFDILDHARLELEGIETRGHAEESGISFCDCGVVWHAPLIMGKRVK